MKERNRCIAALLCIFMLVGTIVTSRNNTLDEAAEKKDNDSLIVWYTDEAMSDYLSAMAVDYHEKFGIRVLPKLQSGSEYVESIYQASMDNNGAPDLYIMSSEAIEKAAMSGCATPISDNRGVVSNTTFPEPALDAVTYHDNIMAYPYYFETTALLYNKTYLHEMAANVVQAENSSAEGETAGSDSQSKQTDADTTSGASSDSQEKNEELTEDEEAQVEVKMHESIPTTFDAFLTFADEFDAPEGVESIYKWDVRDIFYNYFFIGDYISIGGKYGDDVSQIDVYNLDAVKAMKVFQDMNQFFSFEYEDVTYDKVIQEFIEGKLVFATVTTDCFRRLEQARIDGEFEYEYGVDMIPDLNDEMDTRSLSVTNSIVINGYSDKRNEANAFAQYLCISNADSLYEKTGKMPSKKGVFSEDSEEYAFVEEYSYSVPMPKLMATSNSWLVMEGTFEDVWKGTDVSLALMKLSEQLKLQVTGESIGEEYIELPKEEEEAVEYLDEEAMKAEAQKEE